jgi:hypothetical protein
VKLSVEGLLFIVQKLIVVSSSLLQAFSVSPTEDIVSKNSLPKACVSWKRISELDVLLSLFINYLCINPLIVLGCEGLSELLVACKGKLVNFLSSRFDKWLSDGLLTSFTVILVLGTPTISAAVL